MGIDDCRYSLESKGGCGGQTLFRKGVGKKAGTLQKMCTAGAVICIAWWMLAMCQSESCYAWLQLRCRVLKIWGVVLQAKESGAWLWCSQDDWVLDAIRKMTHANVGSLLVFDPSKVEVGGNEDASKAEDAVVGIFTERGRCCLYCVSFVVTMQ